MTINLEEIGLRKSFEFTALFLLCKGPDTRRVKHGELFLFAFPLSALGVGLQTNGSHLAELLRRALFRGD